jgi:hypothetical protein
MAQNDLIFLFADPESLSLLQILAPTLILLPFTNGKYITRTLTEE